MSKLGLIGIVVLSVAAISLSYLRNHHEYKMEKLKYENIEQDYMDWICSFSDEFPSDQCK